MGELGWAGVSWGDPGWFQMIEGWGYDGSRGVSFSALPALCFASTRPACDQGLIAVRRYEYSVSRWAGQDTSHSLLLLFLMQRWKVGHKSLSKSSHTFSIAVGWMNIMSNLCDSQRIYLSRRQLGGQTILTVFMVVPPTSSSSSASS